MEESALNQREFKRELFVSAIADIECGIRKAMFYMEYLPSLENQERYSKLMKLKEEILEVLGFS